MKTPAARSKPVPTKDEILTQITTLLDRPDDDVQAALMKRSWPASSGSLNRNWMSWTSRSSTGHSKNSGMPSACFKDIAID